MYKSNVCSFKNKTKKIESVIEDLIQVEKLFFSLDKDLQNKLKKRYPAHLTRVYQALITANNFSQDKNAAFNWAQKMMGEVKNYPSNRNNDNELLVRARVKGDIEKIFSNADVFTDDPTYSGYIVGVENSPAQGSINIVEDSGTGTLYSFSRNYRWEINASTLNYSNPVQAEFRLYNNSGIGTQLNWDWPQI